MNICTHVMVPGISFRGTYSKYTKNDRSMGRWVKIIPSMDTVAHTNSPQNSFSQSQCRESHSFETCTAQTDADRCYSPTCEKESTPYPRPSSFFRRQVAESCRLLIVWRVYRPVEVDYDFQIQQDRTLRYSSGVLFMAGADRVWESFNALDQSTSQPTRVV